MRSIESMMAPAPRPPVTPAKLTRKQRDAAAEAWLDVHPLILAVLDAQGSGSLPEMRALVALLKAVDVHERRVGLHA